MIKVSKLLYSPVILFGGELWRRGQVSDQVYVLHPASLLAASQWEMFCERCYDIIIDLGPNRHTYAFDFLIWLYEDV